MIKKLIRIFGIVAMAGLAPAFAQTTTTATTLGAAVSNPTPATNQQTLVCLASATGVVLPNLGTGLSGSMLVVDREAFQVLSQTTTLCFQTKRGVYGTTVSGHASGTKVWVGALAVNSGDPGRPLTGGPFIMSPPSGNCTTASQPFTSFIIVGEAYGISGLYTGDEWICPSSGPAASTWVMASSPSSTFSLSDSMEFIPAIGNCTFALPVGVLSAGGFGAAGNTGFGPIQAGAGAATTQNVPVMQASTTNAATIDQHLWTCHIPLPTRLKVTAGTAISDVTFAYGVQGNTLGTQVAVLASGTMNGQIVFTKEVFPVAGASETASTAGPVRADSGSLVITPPVGSFNIATTTVGQFFTAKFAPATPILMNVDLTNFYFSVNFLCVTTVQTTTNTPGFWVHYINVPL